MLTTVPSMKTMLDARIVAARIHGPTCGEQETAAGALNTTASSDGGFVLTLIRSGVESQPGQSFPSLIPCSCAEGEKPSASRFDRHGLKETERFSADI
jgi:hypothetical protein